MEYDKTPVIKYYDDHTYKTKIHSEFVEADEIQIKQSKMEL